MIVNGRTVEVDGNMNMAQPTIHLKANGHNVTTQIVAKRAGEITILFKGTPFNVRL